MLPKKSRLELATAAVEWERRGKEQDCTGKYITEHAYAEMQGRTTSYVPAKKVLLKNYRGRLF